MTDPLSDLLRDTGLARRLLGLREFSGTQALRFPCDRSIGLHLVVRGPMYLHAPSFDAPEVLAAGDIALMARGCDHVLSLQPSLAGQAVQRIDLPPAGTSVSDPVAATSGAAVAAVVSGAYQFWHTPLHPFFAEMPQWSLLRAADTPRLGPLALVGSLLGEELRGREPGALTVVHSLLDAVFAYALRQVMARCAAAQPGWSQALGDPQIGRAVALMHDDLAHPWTLEELARRAGMSRTALAERFRQSMGDTPLSHLRTLRMQRAVQLLSETALHLEAVAAAVGYQDAFTFSKVFKRTVGLSPRAFRQRDLAEKGDPWRFGAG